jgi:dsRNA-specific ribonuclease
MSFAIAAIIGGSIAVAAGGAKLGMALSGRKKRKAEQKAAKAEMEKYKREYKNLDTSNLNANVENQFTNQPT